MKIYTIGFTKKSAEEFFELIRTNDIQSLIDVRLNNKSQLAGFAKGSDLEYFLREICGVKYLYEDRHNSLRCRRTGYPLYCHYHR